MILEKWKENNSPARIQSLSVIMSCKWVTWLARSSFVTIKKHNVLRKLRDLCRWNSRLIICTTGIELYISKECFGDNRRIMTNYQWKKQSSSCLFHYGGPWFIKRFAVWHVCINISHILVISNNQVSHNRTASHSNALSRAF